MEFFDGVWSKPKVFFMIKKKEVRDLINESMIKEKYQQKIGAF